MYDDDPILTELRNKLIHFERELRTFVKQVVEGVSKDWFDETVLDNLDLDKLKRDVKGRYASAKEKAERLKEPCSDDLFNFLEFSNYVTIITTLWMNKKGKPIFSKYFPPKGKEFVIEHLDYLGFHRNDIVGHDRAILNDNTIEKIRFYIKDFLYYIPRVKNTSSVTEDAIEFNGFGISLKKLRELLDMNKDGLEMESNVLLQVYLKPSVQQVDVNELYRLLDMQEESDQYITFKKSSESIEKEPVLVITGCEMPVIDAIEIIAKKYTVTSVFLNELDTNYNIAYELLYAGFTDFPVSIYFKDPLDMARSKELKVMFDDGYNPEGGYPTFYPGDENDEYELEKWEDSTIYPINAISTRDERVDWFDRELSDIDDIAVVKSVHYSVFLKINQDFLRTPTNIKNKHLIPPPRTLVGHIMTVFSCNFSPNGKIIVSGSGDKTLILWDTQTDKMIRTLEGHSGEVTTSAFSPDGKVIVSGSADKTLILWKTHTGKKVRTMAGHSDTVWVVAFSPDGSMIASGSWDKTVKLWDAQTGKELYSLVGHSREVDACAFSPDGTMIISGANDNTLKLWDTRTGKELRTFEGHKGPIDDCVFSPDCKAILSCSADKTLILWESSTGKPIRKYEGTPDGVTACVFSPDGAMIASASFDTTVRIWDTWTGVELQTLVGHSDVVYDCAFSPDGATVASASSDHTLKLWDLRSILNAQNEFEDGTPYHKDVKDL